jgi:hypothetical protein
MMDRAEIVGDTSPPALVQVESAKEAAYELLKVIPGPVVAISLSGHANGVGWQEKPGYANDTITVSITQVVD